MATLPRVEVAPLQGYVVGVTADRRAAEQVELLRRRGATVLHGPTVRTHPFGSEARTAEAIESVAGSPPDLTVLTTGIGVRSLLAAADSIGASERLLAAIASGTVIARGPKACGAAVTAGIDVAWQPAGGTGAEIVDELARRGVAGRRVAVQLDGDDDAPLAMAIADLGADVVAVPVYRWTMPCDTGPAERLLAAVVERRVDAVTFTARPQVANLCRLAEQQGVRAELTAAFAGGVRAACVGPVCASAAVDAGFPDPVVPARHRLGAMVLALAAQLGGSAVETSLAGVPVRIQGQLVVAGGRPLELSDREAGVLRELASRPGAVVSKRQLLDRVWRGAAGDEHAVEVAVARLRRRLGPAGRGIQTVVRRGYRLDG